MKTCRLLLASGMLAATQFSHSQDIPNGGFEDWSSASYFEQPDPFITSNALSYMFGDTVNVIKSTDHFSGTYAAKLETMAFGADTVPGLMMIGQVSGENIIGGVPYTQRPDSLAGYFKYNLVGGDELLIVCLFTRAGLPLGFIQSTFTGTQDNYTRFSIPIDWYIPILTPDSLKVVIANTNDIYSGHAGSTVYLDQMQFIGATSPFPNGDFENWTMLSGEEPDDWTTLNYVTGTSDAPYATMTNDAHSGSRAIRIENMMSFFGEPIGYITNGKFHGYEWTGGLAVDQNPSLVSGYYKYSPQGNDTAQAGVFTYMYDFTGDSVIMVEEQIIDLPQTGTYTYFEIPLDYNEIIPVDTVNLAFSAGLFESGLTEGSVLFLDDIAIEYYPVTVPEKIMAGNLILYPNPSNGVVNILNTFADQGDCEFVVFDPQGRQLLERSLQTIPGETVQVDLTGLMDGLYFYHISGRNTSISGRIILIKQ